MTAEGLVSTGLAAGTAMFLGFGMIKMTERTVGKLIDDGKKQRPMNGHMPEMKPMKQKLPQQQQRSNFFSPKFNYKPMSKVSNAKQYYNGYKF